MKKYIQLHMCTLLLFICMLVFLVLFFFIFFFFFLVYFLLHTICIIHPLFKVIQVNTLVSSKHIYPLPNLSQTHTDMYKYICMCVRYVYLGVLLKVVLKKQNRITLTFLNLTFLIQQSLMEIQPSK